jgi:hypothetical protein
MIKAIETTYKGYRFRSRLEARWAIYFDTCGIEWEYEKEGYDLGDAGYYLPDFWLPQVEMWAEVKGRSFTTDEENKCKVLASESGNEVLMLEGLPDNRWYWAWTQQGYLDQYGVTDYHGYHIAEHRFYGGPGCDNPDDEGVLTENAKNGIAAARSARFEHGEHGAR